MNFDVPDPLTSRARFHGRIVHHMLKLLAVFLGVAVVIAVLSVYVFKSGFFMFVGDVLALSVMIFLFLRLNNKPIRLKCLACAKMILSNTPWTCGFCKQENRDTRGFPFVNTCQHCGNEPKAYKCHHCGGLIYLTEDEQKSGYAFFANDDSERPKPKPMPVVVDKEKIRHEEVREKQHNLAMAKLDAELKAVKEPTREPSADEIRFQLERRFRARLTKVSGARELGVILKSEIAVTYKHSPQERQDLEKFIDCLVREEI